MFAMIPTVSIEVNYFNIKIIGKNKVNMFMNNEWIPIFSSEFFSNPKITSTWDIIVRENNKSDRQAFLNLLGSKLLIAANKKQDELTIPLSELEEKSVQNIMNY